MNNELQKIDFNSETVELIKRTIAKDASDDELKLFLHQCKRTQLDPMTRQIYFMKRSGKVSIQTSIDGFRVIAERSGDYAGQDEPVFGKDESGEMFCKVTVYRFRNDIRYPASVGVAYWKEYCPPSGQDFMWKKMPHTMLSKVAEALALRKAYPQDLSGLYTGDEMDQAPKAEQEIENVPDNGERQLLRNLVYSSDLTEDEKEAAMSSIELLSNYDQYQRIQYKLEGRQLNIDTTANPSQSQIKNHVKKIAKQPA
jgi:phage recombination protein Bet